MIKIDQFIFTTASIDNKNGYQIIAKSKNIADKLMLEMNSYLYPVGVDTAKFTESKSLIILKNQKKIVFSKIKNIGIGYDGRNNTIYNHSLVMSITDFAKISNDSRILEYFYFENYDIRGELLPLKIKHFPKKIFPKKLIIHPMILHIIIHHILNNEKIALLGIKNLIIIQEILSYLPKSLRLLSFSSLVCDIKRQSKYDFIIISDNQEISDFVIIDYKDTKNIDLNSELIDTSIFYLVKLIQSDQFFEVKKIHNWFDQISTYTNLEKMNLVCRYSEFLSTNILEKKMDLAEKLDKLLKQFNSENFPDLYNEIKKSIKTFIVSYFEPIPKMDTSNNFRWRCPVFIPFVGWV